MSDTHKANQKSTVNRVNSRSQMEKNSKFSKGSRKSKQCDENISQVERSAEQTMVHSANSWENADLGDVERKGKFLRLMGAKKKEHHGKIIIGDHSREHEREKDSMEHEQNDLEDQYEQSMQHRLDGGRRGHIGLGFHEDNPEDAKKRGEESGENAAVGSIMETCDVGDDGFTKDDRHKRKSTEEPNRSDDPDVKKIRFVKASS